MTHKKGIKLILRLTTIVTLVMVATSMFIIHAMAAVTTSWTPTDTGLILSSTLLESKTNITKTSDNYFVIVWADDRNGSWDIFGQKLNAAGDEQWSAGGIGLVTGAGNQPSSNADRKISIIPDKEGGIILSWVDQNDSNSVYVRKVNSLGTTDWTVGPIGTLASVPTLLEDGQGGAYLTYQASVESPPLSENYSSNIYATHIDGTFGQIDWNDNIPVEVAVTTHDESNPQVVRSSDGIIITYRHYYQQDFNEYFGLRTTKIASTGNIHPDWNPFVTTIPDSLIPIDNHRAAPDGQNGVTITYQHNYSDIKAQRINVNYQTFNIEPLWGTTGINVANTSGTQEQPQIIYDNFDGFIIIWEDNSATPREIYAQKINLDGSTNWAVNGILISNDGMDKYLPSIFSNGGSGAIIAYITADSGITRSDLKAQLITSSGTRQWGAGGTFVETEAGITFDLYPVMTDNGSGGAVVTWLRETSLGGASQIHTQYLDESQGATCLDPGGSRFCGTQIISSSTLTFTDIPDSFNYGLIQSGAISHICASGSSLASPSYICSTDQTPPPGPEHLLKIYDNRDSGGFIVNLTPGENTFTDGIHAIPLTNLYVLTTLPETPPEGQNNNGITYNATGEQGIIAPAFVNEFTPDFVDISDPDEYTTRASASQFGNGAVLLMDGTLSENLGRNGYFSTYVNYYLKIDANQEPGNYALLMTYDLMDSSTI